MILVFFLLVYPFQDTIDFSRSWAKRVLGDEGFSSGYALAAGDIDRDGYQDLVVGCPGASKIYIIYGPLGDTTDLLWPSGRRTVIRGRDSVGTSAAIADFNQDGYTDLAFSDLDGNGTLYIALGPISDSLDLWGNLWAQRIVYCPGLYYHCMLGSSFAVGDFNGDGYPDLAAGAPGATFYWREKAGIVYIIMGRERFNSVEYLDGWHSVKTIQGALSYDQIGSSLAAADFNGDGMDDLAIGAIGLSYRQGAGGFYILYGQATIPDVIDMLYTDEVRLALVFGEREYGSLGNSLSAGDFNGDGLLDLAVGACAFGEPEVNAGRAYILYFPLESETLDMAMATRITRIIGSQANALLAWRLSAGFVNHDDRSDLLVSAPTYDIMGRADAGQAYLVLSPFPETVRVDEDEPGVHHFFGAEPRDEMGRGLLLWDMNQDGEDDVVIGAPFSEPFGGREKGGIAYVVEDSVDTTENVAWNENPGGFPGVIARAGLGAAIFLSPGDIPLRIYSADGRLACSAELFRGENRIKLKTGVYVWLAGPHKGKLVIRGK
ncbi:MAG: FG-GAP and VCBS repeat-containing protein [candidate division WOR-3 bacterium]